ncbi:MAG: C-GCAxxG-C-C family protein [Muribaculaceae bacterium]|nr:C-GCAxxG-C-C family protein [Muribaculaceae bacterium]
MIHDIDFRISRAMQLRKEGYNCAQCVLMVFDDFTGLDSASACRAASGLGAGVGAMKELCGVPNAMAIVQGFALPAEAPAKVESMKRAGELLRLFGESTGGRLRCADLKGGPNAIPCDRLICDGIRILHDFISRS